MKNSIAIILVTVAFLLASCGAQQTSYKRHDGFSQGQKAPSKKPIRN